MGNHKGLSSWQLAMLALGTVIGRSFFLGSSVAIHAAGPSILISYILGGILVYLILFAFSEMTVANPDSGSFRTFATDAFGPGLGFVVGWVYWTGMVLAMSSEATAVSILISRWVPDISVNLLGSIIIIAVTLLNMLGSEKLSKLESALAAVKLFAIISFIVIALLLITGLIGNKQTGTVGITDQPFMQGGLMGIAGSMLVVMFSYAGFEVIGLAASETAEPGKTIPRAIAYTVLFLVGSYIVSVAVLLPLIPTSEISEEVSPMVAALNRWGIGWAGTAINIVLISAILSTMLAAMFGIGRMMRSLADEDHAPDFLKDKGDIPYKGILFSGSSMLFGLAVGQLLPRVYIFLISSGGFALLFTYTVIMATHIRFRKAHGCPPEGNCQMPGYPYTSLIALVSIILIILSMPAIPGQGTGLVAGIIMIVFYSIAYLVYKFLNSKKDQHTENDIKFAQNKAILNVEFSKELDNDDKNIH